MHLFRDWTEDEIALAALMYIGEDEAFPEFKEWAIDHAQSKRFKEWAAAVTVNDFRMATLRFMHRVQMADLERRRRRTNGGE